MSSKPRVLIQTKGSPPLDQAPTSIPRYQDMAWGSPHAQTNYPVSTSYADEDGRLSIVSQIFGTTTFIKSLTVTQVKDQPVQLLHHTAPVPITQAQVSFQSYHRDAPLVDAVTPHYKGGAQGRASDDTINPSVALSSPDISIVLPRAVGHPLEYPQDNENVSKSGEPPLAHHATTEPTTGPTSTALFAPLSNVSWPSSSNSVVPPLQGPYPSDHLDGGNILTPVEWAASPTWLTWQSYLPPNQQIEVASTPIVSHIPPYILPTPSQSNSSAHAANSHLSTSIPPFQSSPLPSSSEFCTHDGLSDIGSGNLPIPAGPAMVDYLLYGIMIDGFEANQARGPIRARRRTKMKRGPCASEPISTRRAGRSAKIQSRSRMRPSAVRPLSDRNVRTCCGWQNEDGRLCGEPVTYNNCAEHFAAVHEIKNMAADTEVLCRWCALGAEKKMNMVHQFCADAHKT
ncbi:hypothetical protein F5J12DRAFT_209603 [Pisolithus orientalis]|uniref:uncharacterized protein n=1 Tax=Pisolithus orientalis TaxID=936130 RepID=UPI0022252133|nr:uncharacterized protein F5J12DRAFT_209603 [Pisolithus orientalis]KAI6002668.1 hypothetical protein F5J12DRAFT_209603 [Pisolithus orientalis]